MRRRKFTRLTRLTRFTRCTRSRAGALVTGAAGALCVLLLLAALESQPSHPSSTTDSARSNRAAPAEQSDRLAGRSADGWLSSFAPRTGVAGRVFGPRGPVAGAHVCATRAGTDPLTAASSCVTADTHGDYVVDGLAPGAYVVAASAAALALDGGTSNARLLLAAGELRTGFDLTLREGVRVAGCVVDALGGPVVGARVRVVRAGLQRLSMDTATDRNGEFVLWAAQGPIMLSADAHGYAGTSVAGVAPSERVTLTLTPAGQLRGRVVTARDGAPVASARVRADPVVGSGVRRVPMAAQTGTTGAFVLQPLEAGAYQLVAEAPGLRGRLAAPLELGLAQSRDEIVIEVLPAARVHGRVLDAQGHACSLGSVFLGAPLPGLGEVSATTANLPQVPTLSSEIALDGSVRFDAVPPGDYLVTVRCEDHIVRAGPSRLEVRDRDLEGLLWRVAPGGGLSVRVTDAAGKAVAYARFVLGFPGQAAGPQVVMPLSTDERGRYDTPTALHPGMYTLTASHGAMDHASDTHHASDTRRASVLLREGEGRVPVTLTLPGSATLTVHVRTPADEPIEDVTVRATAIRELADARPALSIVGAALGRGSYRVGPLPAGAYAVSAHDGTNPAARPEGPAAIDVADGNHAELQIVLERGATLRGRVVHTDGRAARDVWVSARCDDCADYDDLGLAARRTLTDDAGGFALEGLSLAARYSVQAEQPYGASAVAHGVPASEPVTLELPPLVALWGAARDSTGAPVSRFTLQAHHTETGLARNQLIVDAAGRFLLEGLMPGHLELDAIDARGRAAHASVLVAAASAPPEVTLAFTDPPQPLAASDPSLVGLAARTDRATPATQPEGE
jgi:Carboxypeptidase regulatory-like domain